ncbi:MAG: heavy metal-binding domain-containing protein [Polyangiaceae bacterium]
MEALLGILSVSSLLLIGWYWGARRRALHRESLAQRESQLEHVLVSSSKHYLGSGALAPRLVTVELVWGLDRFQAFLAALVNLFGGEMESVSEVMARARREALVRLKADAHAAGYDALANLRMETADIGNDPQQRDLKVALIGSATAYRRHPAGL